MQDWNNPLDPMHPMNPLSINPISPYVIQRALENDQPLRPVSDGTYTTQPAPCDSACARKNGDVLITATILLGAFAIMGILINWIERRTRAK